MRILHVEDNPQDADLTRLVLGRAMPEVMLHTVVSLAEARRALAGSEPFDVVLADLGLADGSGLELLAELRAKDLPLAVVVLTGTGDERSAVAALKAGADDYLVKRGDFLAELPQVLVSAVAFKADQARRSRAVRVLYAEHNMMDVDITRRHLARHAPHIRLESAGTGERALELLCGEARFDVLLLDYRLAGMNALELLAALRDESGAPRLPVVVVTGHGDESVAAQALRLGAADYLIKRTGYLHELTPVIENAHHRAVIARQQLALRRSQSSQWLSERALDAITQGVLVTDAQRRIIYVNEAFTRITGYTEEESLGKPCSFLQGPESDPETVSRMSSALAAGRSFRAVIANRRKAGGLFWNQLTITPVRDEAGELTHFVGVQEDVTVQRSLEDQLRQAQKMEAIGQLSGGVAHDFNNLLTVISGHLGLLEATGRVTPEISESIHEISQAATRAANLTRQLLTFSRRQVMQSRPLDLCEVVDGVMKMLARILGEDIAMTVECPARPAMVRADQGMMEQILLNLTINARDAMPEGGRLVLAVDRCSPGDALAAGCRDCGDPESAEKPASLIRLTVADTGHGIAPEIRDKIFEPFFTTKEVGKGTGLGLATVYGIARQHHGGCAVRSEPGRGAVFMVFFPELATFSARPAAPAKTSGGGAGGGHETILLVEDDEGVAAMMRMALELAGYTVLEAASGVQALEVWREQAGRVDLLLTDYLMPDGMTGNDLAKRVLVDRPALPVIYTSGYSADIAGRDLGEGGTGAAGYFLAKPFTRDSLLDTVRRALDGRKR
jgi:PAS domain S-box-containing protein